MEQTSKVKKTTVLNDPGEGCVTGEMLRALRSEMGLSLSEFGLKLRRAVDGRAKRGYTRQYISRLEHGQDAITDELRGAFYNLAGVLDEVPAGLGGAVSVRLLAQPGQVVEGALLKQSMRAKRCQGCNVIFIGPGKFHHEDCRKGFWRRVRHGGTK